VGVAILIGFFEFPLLNPEQSSQLGADSAQAEFSARDFIQDVSEEENISNLSDILESTRTIEILAPYYAFYTFLVIAVLYFLGALSSLLKAIFRGGKGVGFFGGIFRIIIIPIFYILLPLGVMVAFYAFATGLYDISNVISRPSSFRLDRVQEIMNRLPPGLGMILMVGGSIFGGIVAILSTIIGMFTRSTPQVIMMGQPAYGMPPQYGQPQYPPQYGQPQQPPYGQYPPQQNPYGGQPPQYPPTQTPPYQQPPVQNPYGGNQPPQNPYGAPPPQYPPSNQPQNPIDWGKKRDDDDEF
ncbi:MAG: hypothetical protein KJ043_22265, partial [Anaerolineae bacterium]|nr:hypothetical protein [Anaerolineae bacterium]